jgi:hypothetical protein
VCVGGGGREGTVERVCKLGWTRRYEDK